MAAYACHYNLDGIELLGGPFSLSDYSPENTPSRDTGRFIWRLRRPVPGYARGGVRISVVSKTWDLPSTTTITEDNSRNETHQPAFAVYDLTSPSLFSQGDKSSQLARGLGEAFSRKQDWRSPLRVKWSSETTSGAFSCEGNLILLQGDSLSSDTVRVVCSFLRDADLSNEKEEFIYQYPNTLDFCLTCLFREEDMNAQFLEGRKAVPCRIFRYGASEKDHADSQETIVGVQSILLEYGETSLSTQSCILRFFREPGEVNGRGYLGSSFEFAGHMMRVYSQLMPTDSLILKRAGEQWRIIAWATIADNESDMGMRDFLHLLPLRRQTSMHRAEGLTGVPKMASSASEEKQLMDLRDRAARLRLLPGETEISYNSVSEEAMVRFRPGSDALAFKKWKGGWYLDAVWDCF